MKQIIILFYFVLFCVDVNGQQYLNRKYEFYNEYNPNVFSAMNFNNNEFYCAGGFAKNNNLLTAFFSKVDLNTGEIEDSSLIESDSLSIAFGNLGGGFPEINQSFYYFGSSKKDSTGTGILFKLNKSCDTIYTKQIVDSNYENTFFYLTRGSGLKLLGVGYVDYWDSLYNKRENRVLFIETDTLGNVIWKKTFGYAHSIVSVSTFKPSSEGGYYIIGTISKHEQWMQNYLVKTDSLGNLLWQRIWGATYDDELFDIHELSNGNLMLTGYTSTDILLPRACITIMNTNATQQISQQLHMSSSNAYVTFTRIFPNSVDTYDVWGNEQNGTIIRPFLLKLNSNFDSIDFHYYSYWNEGFQPVNVLRDIVRLPDSGYVACGFGWDQYSGQDAWLLRIDKDGCANVNCTPLNVTKNNANNFQIYPNPAHEILQVSSDETIKQCLFYDIYGKVIMTIDSFQGSRNIDVSNLSDGLYLLKIQFANGEERSKKISIVH
jgi:hypothetical protein